MRRRGLVIGGVLAAVLAGGILLWHWESRPRHPDVATTPIDDAVAFVGTQDFNCMSKSDRVSYCLAVAERLRERSFPQLLAMAAARNGQYKKVAENVDKTGASDDIEAAVLRVMMDKFYDETSARRSIYLWGLVKLQQAGKTGDDGIGLPTGAQLQSDMTRVLTRQPPQTVAKMGQFVQDLQQERRSMGVPDPY